MENILPILIIPVEELENSLNSKGGLSAGITLHPSSLSLRSEGRQVLSRDRCVSCHPRTFLSGIYNMKIRGKEVEKYRNNEAKK
jgi:hypothetical protein